MTTIHHTLTTIEAACGVTLEQVAKMRTKILLIENGEKAVFPQFTSAALASSTARFAFGSPAKFAGFNNVGLPVYQKIREQSSAQ